MERERNQQIDELFHSALERDLSARSAFLAEACAGDEELRREVTSLLAAYEQAGDLIERPVADAAAYLLANNQARSLVGRQIGHYQIIELIGAGGMGEVYLAEDSSLGRRVALKLLPALFTADKERVRRFRREARAASSLNHPNVLTIHEIGEIDSAHFIATEFIDGVTLREHMAGTQMKVAEALDVATQVASALAAAHEDGVVHRDIKPENVMLRRRDGIVKVLDFGLAKLTERIASVTDPAEAATQKLTTHPGVVMGTVTYMSPEQVRGLEVDTRTDIWSLGVVLYEMMAARMPFDGLTASDVMAAILKTDPLPITRFSPKAPTELQRIIKKALCKKREERYQTIEDILLDLRSLQREIETGTEPERLVQAGEMSSIAILPFRNLTNDETVSFYEFSLADAVITELVRLRSLIVRPSSVIAKYLGQNKDPLEIGRELSVKAVLTASFLYAKDRMRVTAQLIDVVNGEVLWGERIDSDADDIITAQDTIAQRIIDGLQLKLSSNEQINLAGHATANAVAYEAYLRGRDRMRRYIYQTVANEDVEAAITHFKRAIELDLKFALAYCALGVCYVNRVIKHLTGDVGDLRHAQEAFAKGLSLDPEIIEARVYVSFTYSLCGEKQKASAEMAKLRHEFPNNFGVHSFSAYLYRLDGDYDKALLSLDNVLRLNPTEQVLVSYNRARLFMYQGRYDDALIELDRGATVEAEHPLLKIFRAVALFRRGDPAIAAEVLREVLASHPEMDGFRPHLAMCLSAMGEHDAARAELTDRVKEVAAVDHDVPYWLASAYLMEGMYDDAFEWLERAISLGNENRPWFESNPVWEAARDDPRFKALMNRIEAGREGRAGLRPEKL